jgi:prepilin-type N-terminal cleavage/methylation domain-containing protein
MNRIHYKFTKNINRRSFTLVELMVVIVIIGIMASMTLAALSGVIAQAKGARTRTQITKLHSMIMFKWESYRYRQVPIPIPSWLLARPETFIDTNGNCWWDSGEAYTEGTGSYANGRYDYGGAYIRLLALRELMRMELPDRISDLEDGPMSMTIQGLAAPLQLSEPSIWKSYRRKATAATGFGPAGRNPGPDGIRGTDDDLGWNEKHQGAECLYLIVSSIRDGDTSGLDFFKQSEVDDTDGDGMPEILDGWGRPIAFLRWAPGFATGEGPDKGWGVQGVDDDNQNGIDDIGEVGWPGSDDRSELQSRNVTDAPDPFDPLQVSVGSHFALYPLIFSAGADSIYDITTDYPVWPSPAVPPSTLPLPFRYSDSCNDPYVLLMGNMQMGQPGGLGEGSFDNITNHLLDSR